VKAAILKDKAPYKTQIDLTVEMRRPLAALLNRHLVDMIDLFNQTKYAHWNVKGKPRKNKNAFS